MSDVVYQETPTTARAGLRRPAVRGCLSDTAARRGGWGSDPDAGVHPQSTLRGLRWRGSAAPAVSVAKWHELEALFTCYRTANPREVRAFLERNPHLAPLLVEAYPVILQCFGAGTPVRLDLFRPAEDPDAPELFVLIQWDGPVGEALHRMEHFEDRWWLEASARAACRMNVDVEFT